MIQPHQPDDHTGSGRDLIGTILAALIVMLGTWILLQLFRRPLLAAICWLLA